MTKTNTTDSPYIESILISLDDLHPDDQECIRELVRKCAISPEEAMLFYSYGFHMCELLTAYQMQQEMN